MARYRGRHRAPSNTGRRLAHTALVGAVAGAPLLVAAPAYAASDATWDRVAQCESGGRWDINTGNGYHGGLQFSPRTWTGFGGGEFASVAYRATRAQQIVVAERVLAKQGWGAWPVCSRKAGARGESASQRSAPAQQSAPAPRSAPVKPSAPTQRVRLSAPVAAAPTSSGAYVVKRGDSLSKIAAQEHVAGGWKALVQKNPALAANPNLILPGRRIGL